MLHMLHLAQPSHLILDEPPRQRRRKQSAPQAQTQALATTVVMTHRLILQQARSQTPVHPVPPDYEDIRRPLAYWLWNWRNK